MKRLVFCFDGTWNRLDAATPTNVVVTAESVLPLTRDSIAQLIFYDEGVGTRKWERFTGGMFGAGLVKNLADAYRFLIFNHTPGDEIYIFGFSRGAYTARSFAGLLANCGILLRKYASKADEAIELYKQRDDTTAYNERLFRFRSEHSPQVWITEDENTWRQKQPSYDAGATRLYVHYLGVWDTVGALGIPTRYSLLSWINKKHQFHNTVLSTFVKSARHAVAIDEHRKDFAPTLWDNFEKLNAGAGFKEGAPDAPYQQVWFPGVHSSVGGGGERRGLSDQALDWVLDGASLAGLSLDSSQYSRIFELKPNYKEYLEPTAKQGLAYKLMNRFGGGDRENGPTQLFEVSVSARRRWLDQPANLSDEKQYRPPTLSGAAGVLNALDPSKYGIGVALPVPGAGAAHELYEVKRGDTLSAIAKHFYGHAQEYPRIYNANLDKLDDPDHIYAGQLLKIPKDQATGPAQP